MFLGYYQMNKLTFSTIFESYSPENISAARQVIPPSGPGKARKRKRGSRTTTGCLCCRLRHKKCDEETPICGGCWRNSLICSWPQRDGNDQPSTDSGWRKRLLSGKYQTIVIRGSKDPDSEESNNLKQNPLQEVFMASDTCQNISWESKEAVRYRAPRFPLSINPGHLTLMNGNARILFSHYATETANPLSTRPDGENPFVANVLPRAQADSLIMSAVIALSGVHFCYKFPNTEMLYTTWSYYAQAIRGLKHELTRLDGGDDESLIRLLFVTILLCHVEVEPPLNNANKERNIKIETECRWKS